MKTTIAPATYDFLRKLKKNNNREWFNANKKLYQAALDDFTGFVASFIDGLSKFDKNVKGLDPKKSIFRIHRDTRFSKDKSPYKTHFATRLHKPGHEHVAGFYLSVAPDEAYIAGGIYGPEPGQLHRLRTHISSNGKGFIKIIGNKKFEDTFGTLWEEGKLKTPPKGFDKEDPMIEYMKNKNFVVSHKIPKAMATSPKLLAYVLDKAKLIVPFHDFLNAT